MYPSSNDSTKQAAPEANQLSINSKALGTGPAAVYAPSIFQDSPTVAFDNFMACTSLMRHTTGQPLRWHSPWKLCL
jgi:hypothetical protein